MNTSPPDATNVVALRPKDIQTLLSDAPFRWWIAGGWALDLFMCGQTRPHFDVDVAIARRDQGAAQKHLPRWDFQYAVRIDDKVVLRPWESGQFLGREVHGVWARPTTDAPWRFEFALHEIEEDVWTFRYFDTVRILCGASKDERRRVRCKNDRGIHMKHKSSFPWFKDESEVITSFGQAQLVRYLDGKCELRLGSREDRQAAKEWISMLWHEMVVRKV